MGPKNRNAASAAAPAKRADQQLQGRKYPQDPAAKSNTWREESMWFQDYISG